MLQNDFLPWTYWRHQLHLFVKSNIWVCFWLICKRGIKKDVIPILWYNCMCVYILLFYWWKNYAHCCFSIDKIKKIKKCIALSSFWMSYWKYTYFGALPLENICCSSSSHFGTLHPQKNKKRNGLWSSGHIWHDAISNLSINGEGR